MKKLEDLLAEARRVKGASLRDVEKATGISNAYVSQLESGVVSEPSPKKLRALAEYYGISYAALMKSCGYFLPDEVVSNSPDSFMGQRLSDDESSAMAAFLHELRRRKKREK